MRHVADGELHAYLDGGLDHYPPDEAGRIRKHLTECGSCRDRLEDERRARVRAAAVLAGADPGAVEAPPFEELRRRALAGDGDGRPGEASGLGRAGWLRIAATAVVALGVGWMGGRMSPYGPLRPAAPVFDAASAPREGADPEGPGRGALSGVVAGSQEEAASPVGRVEEEASLPPEGEAAGDPAQRRPGGSADGDLEAPAPSRAAAVDTRRGGAARLAERTLQDRAAAQASEPLPAADPEERLPRVRDLAVAPDEAGMAGVPIASVDSITGERERDEAAGPRADSIAAYPGPERRALSSQLSAVASGVESERPAAIPGLAVVTVQWTEVAPGVEGLRVVQRLVTGDTIELRFGGLDSNADEPDSLLAEELPDGIQQVVAPFGDGWVVARAPLTREEIRALIGRLR